MKLKKQCKIYFIKENPRIGEAAGIQYTSNAYFEIIFSAIKKVSLWKGIQVNYILDKREMLFKSFGINEPLAIDELPHPHQTISYR